MNALWVGVVIGIGTLAGAQAAAAAGPNVSGKWAIQRTMPNGIVQQIVIDLNQAGGSVDGSVSGGAGGGGSTSPVNNEIYDGKADGQTVTFYVWRGLDRPVKTFYKGTLSPAGDEIAFTVTGGQVFPGGGGGAPTPAAAASTPGAQAAVAVRPAPGAGTPQQVTAKRVRQ
jgi:hypothetical protein